MIIMILFVAVLKTALLAIAAAAPIVDFSRSPLLTACVTLTNTVSSLQSFTGAQKAEI